jgi:hypothetical protein
MSLDHLFSLPGAASCSICVVALDPTTGKAIQTNDSFTQRLGPLYKFQEYAFWDAATAGESRDTLRKGIQQVMMSLRREDGNNKQQQDKQGRDGEEEEEVTVAIDSLCVHAVEMLTLGGDAGMPRKRYFDWTIGTTTTTTTPQGDSNPDDDDDDDDDDSKQQQAILLFGTVTAAAAATFSSGDEEVESEEGASNKINRSKFKDSEFVDFFQNAP